MKLQELLNEEANTSLMYYKLFPNQKIIQELGDYGFEFKMGSGLKLMKRHLSRANRASGVHKHRTMQSIVITLNGRLYREIPKAKWVALVDPSDQNSRRYGDIFLDKLLTHSRAQSQIKAKQLGISLDPTP